MNAGDAAGGGDSCVGEPSALRRPGNPDVEGCVSGDGGGCSGPQYRSKGQYTAASSICAAALKILAAAAHSAPRHVRAITSGEEPWLTSNVQSKKCCVPGPGRARPTTQTGDALVVDCFTRAMEVGLPLPTLDTDGCDWGWLEAARPPTATEQQGKRSRSRAAIRARQSWTDVASEPRRARSSARASTSMSPGGTLMSRAGPSVRASRAAPSSGGGHASSSSSSRHIAA